MIGGCIGFIERSGFIDLSLSENPLGCSPKVLEVIRKGAGRVVHYPDHGVGKLKKALSRKFGISVNQICLTNGSEVLLDLIPRVILNSRDEVVLPEVTFPLIERMIVLNGGISRFVPMGEDFGIDLTAVSNSISKCTKLVFLCNPNNPTGKVLPRRKILRFVKKFKKVLVVVDEANIEFGGESVVKDVAKLNNLAVVRTFSKGFGLAGLRVGVCFGPKKLIGVLEKVRQPFPVSQIASDSAIAALGDDRFMARTKKIMDRERRSLTRELGKRGFGVVESDANNLLVKVDEIFGSSGDFVDKLSRRGVEVVDGNSFRGLGNKFIRISPRRREVNTAFLRAVDLILERG